MPRARSTRRRLVAAVSTVLAVTLGAGALAVPASAAPVAGTAAVTAQTATAPIPFPKGHKLADAGVKGFLTRSADGLQTRFAWYAGGTASGYGSRTYLRSTRTNDFLVFAEHYKVTLRDLTTMGIREVALDPLTNKSTYVGSAADAVFTTDGTDLLKHTIAGGTGHVAGLPTGATAVTIQPGTPDDALVQFTVDSVRKWALLDLATDTIGKGFDLPAGATLSAVSATHVAWAKGDANTRAAVFVMDRATEAVQEVPVEQPVQGEFLVRLVGGWVVYGAGGAFEDYTPLGPVTAYHLATKTKTKLLDHMTSAATAGDGSLYVRGGSVAQGEGMYKITATGDDAPAVTLVASTGESTALQITGNDVPATVDLDKNGGKAKFTWTLSRPGANVQLRVWHTRTGADYRAYDYPQDTTQTTFEWQGSYNGDYTWELTAQPTNFIGPAAIATGSFTATRTPKPHDFDDDGSPDVFLRDTSGRLWRANTTYNDQLKAYERRLIGPGWQIYDRIEVTGDVAGSPVADLVSRDRTGVLWLHQGDGRGGFAPRISVGGGWQVYNQLAGGSDLTGDGRADLVGLDKAGDLWLHKGTGAATTPFAARKKIGYGWGVYNQLAAVGDIAGGPAGDLVARDAAGVLWLYLGKGDGTFAARTRIGGGWNTYQHLVGVGDANRDGRPDLVGFGAQGQYLYRGTGNWQAPFLGPQGAVLTSPYDGPYDGVA
ncbi:FG-GAP repeat domain-containing protein [Streptomyces sp. NPDC004266]|uniref:FG-GAP repeat domain-containing protein n=1 Tax=Streptomyces sp. NPDC004266 TaxID=3364693 RepID=UPI0036B9E18F